MNFILENNTFEGYESALPLGVEEEYKSNKKIDTDLDEEVLSNQLQSLFEHVQPELNTIMPSTSTSTSKSILAKEKKVKRTDEEKFMDYIHGLNLAEVQTEQRKSIPKKKSTGAIKRFDVPNNIFDGSAFRSSPTITAPETTKVFRQSVVTQTIRKPDGSYETRSIVRDIDGNTKTTLTRTHNGKTETITSFNDQHKDGKITTDTDKTNKIIEFDKIGMDNSRTDDSNIDINNSVKCHSHVFVSKDGYALPKNLW